MRAVANLLVLSSCSVLARTPAPTPDGGHCLHSYKPPIVDVAIDVGLGLVAAAFLPFGRDNECSVGYPCPLTDPHATEHALERFAAGAFFVGFPFQWSAFYGFSIGTCPRPASE